MFAIQVPNPIAGGLEVVDPPPLSEDMMGWWMNGGERINGRIDKKHPPQPEKYRQRAKKGREFKLMKKDLYPGPDLDMSMRWEAFLSKKKNPLNQQA